MRKILFPVLFTVITSFCYSQNWMTKVHHDVLHPSKDSLISQIKSSLSISKEDTNKVNLLNQLAGLYIWNKPDSALIYSTQCLELLKKLDFHEAEIQTLHYMGEAFAFAGNLVRALETKLEALRMSEKLGDPALISEAFLWLGTVYTYTGDHNNALSFYTKAKSNSSFFKENQKIVNGFIGETYFGLNRLDSAFFYIRKAYELDLVDDSHWPIPYFYLGEIYFRRNQPEMALKYYRQSVEVYTHKMVFDLGLGGMASVFKRMGQIDSAIYYSKLAYEKGNLMVGSSLLTEIYKSQNNSDSALRYQGLMVAAKDSFFNVESAKQLQNVSFREQIRQNESEAEKLRIRNRTRTVGLAAAVAVFLLLAMILYRNNRQKQKANTQLQQQKEEIQNTLKELRSTQAQLVQREKMASLGELTAGIAHEIQNPLNFVNNFSEVNKELIDEMREALQSGNTPQALDVAASIEQNLEKINHHGQRADNIVKGMLQHSGARSGEKEPTDINALADEYLRLAYHGMRARDKSFNAKLETSFDQAVKKTMVVPQDIGRALLNLINNAFYAVIEKKKDLQDAYDPVVSVSTRKLDNKIEIRIRDNGVGIPQKVVDKIFQPFFTTKPTGQGTGLGLSLSYDIIAKEHGGELKVETKESEFAEFIIQLPENRTL